MTLRDRARAHHHVALESARMWRYDGDRLQAAHELRRAARARAVFQHADRLEAAL